MSYVNYFGTHISVIKSKDELIEVDKMIHKECSAYVTYSNVHVVETCIKDRQLREAINSADLVSPDGMPLVKVAKWNGVKEMEKCSGPDMMLRIIEDGLAKDYKHYFYGSTPETLKRLVNNVKALYPNIHIVGSYSPPFRRLTEEEDQRVVETIEASGADCIWIGLGAPKQEVWMYNHRALLHHGVMFGVGAAFDFHAGTLQRAPLWMQKSGLEWFYRLIKEPRRLWRRYLYTNSAFLWHLMAKGIRIDEEYEFENQISRI